MVGICVSGIKSTGSRLSEMPPSRMMTPLIMNIVTGRSMAKRGIDIIYVSVTARRSPAKGGGYLSLLVTLRAFTAFATAEFLPAGSTELALTAELTRAGAGLRSARSAGAGWPALARDDQLIVVAHRGRARGDEAIAFLEAGEHFDLFRT